VCVCVCVYIHDDNIVYNRWRPANRYATAAIPADATACRRPEDDQRTRRRCSRHALLPHTPPRAPRVAVSRTRPRLIRPEHIKNKNKIKHDPQDVACPNNAYTMVCPTRAALIATDIIHAYSAPTF